MYREAYRSPHQLQLCINLPVLQPVVKFIDIKFKLGIILTDTTYRRTCPVLAPFDLESGGS